MIIFSKRIDFQNDFEQWRGECFAREGILPAQTPATVLVFLMSTEKGREWTQQLVKHHNEEAAREAEDRARESDAQGNYDLQQQKREENGK